MMSYTSNSYGYQRPNSVGYSQPQQGMMGAAGVYAGAPVVSFPAPPAAPQQPKPFYRCWDNVQKKWFYWEKDSSVTAWTEPPAHVTLIDHETGSVVQREHAAAPVARQAPVVAAVAEPSSSHSTSANAYANPASRMAAQPHQGVATASSQSTGSVATASKQSSVSGHHQSTQRFQPTLTGTINPNYSAGVSRYTQPSATMNAAHSAASAAEKARLEEADRLIAEQLQKQLSMEAEAELVATCPLPGEAAKLLSSQKKKLNFGKPAAAAAAASNGADDKDIADMAKHGFVVKKQKPKGAAANNKPTSAV